MENSVSLPFLLVIEVKQVHVRIRTIFHPLVDKIGRMQAAVWIWSVYNHQHHKYLPIIHSDLSSLISNHSYGATKSSLLLGPVKGEGGGDQEVVRGLLLVRQGASNVFPCGQRQHIFHLPFSGQEDVIQCIDESRTIPHLKIIIKLRILKYVDFRVLMSSD